MLFLIEVEKGTNMKHLLISLFIVILIVLISLFCYQLGEKKGYQKGFDIGYSNQCRISNQEINGKNHFIDKRDGQRYKIVKIGHQVWMAENLIYKTKYSICYNNDESYCKTYGRLYPWNDAIIACPAGWHLPNDNEFNLLIQTVGYQAGKKLKSSSLWDGTDSLGFNAIGAGSFSPANYIGKNEDAFGGIDGNSSFWSATQYDDQRAYGRGIEKGKHNVIKFWANKVTGHSVRCIKD